MNKQSLKKAIEKTIEEYNKYRSPEAETRLISMDDKFMKIEFTGHFCYTCGFYDYFEDFKFLLDDFGLKAEIAEINEIDGGAIVKFRMES